MGKQSHAATNYTSQSLLPPFSSNLMFRFDLTIHWFIQHIDALKLHFPDDNYGWDFSSWDWDFVQIWTGKWDCHSSSPPPPLPPPSPPPLPPPPFVTLLSNLRRVNQLAVTMCKEVVNGLFPVPSATIFKRLRKFIPIHNNSDNNLFISRPLSGAGI